MTEKQLLYERTIFIRKPVAAVGAQSGVWGEKSWKCRRFSIGEIVATSVDGYHVLVTHMSRLAIIISVLRASHLDGYDVWLQLFDKT